MSNVKQNNNNTKMAEMYKESNLQKFKVAQLKKLLEERGLSATGNKPELISRLIAIGAGQGVLNVSEKDILEDDSILDDSSLNLSLSNGKPLVVSSLNQPSSNVSNLLITAPSSGTIVKSATPSPSVGNKLDSRLKRFGVVSEQARKAARSERFLSSSSASIVKDSTNIKVTCEDAIKKRAERFGLATNIVADKTPLCVDQLKRRAERFGQVTSSSLSKVDLEERLLKRKARFISGDTSSSSEDQKSKRLQRFGTVTAP